MLSYRLIINQRSQFLAALRFFFGVFCKAQIRIIHIVFNVYGILYQLPINQL